MMLNMEVTIKVDKQCRMVLPKEVRKALGGDGEVEMVCRVVEVRLYWKNSRLAQFIKPSLSWRRWLQA
jgi:bifunctional DNA-binding transcriptional regulator/antitoxin component of YhaV-PrlF toxin-antitoxin module